MSSDAPWQEPDTIVPVVEVDDRDDVRTVHIIEHPEDPDAGDQYYVSVTEQTPVFEHTAEIRCVLTGDVARQSPSHDAVLHGHPTLAVLHCRRQPRVRHLPPEGGRGATPSISIYTLLHELSQL